MPRWTVDAPRTIDLDDVVALRVRLISGTVAVLSTGERPYLDVGKLAGQPLLVYRVMRAIVREVHSILRRMNIQFVELTNYVTKQHGRY